MYIMCVCIWMCACIYSVYTHTHTHTQWIHQKLTQISILLHQQWQINFISSINFSELPVATWKPVLGRILRPNLILGERKAVLIGDTCITGLGREARGDRFPILFQLEQVRAGEHCKSRLSCPSLHWIASTELCWHFPILHQEMLQ